MFKNILVPVDLAVEASQSAVAAAVALTKATKDARITLLNVIAPTSPVVTQYLPEDWAEQADARAQGRLKEIAKANGLADGQVRLRHGVVYDEILTEARDSGCDLVIMASHHPVISDYLLGSNAATVVRHADCSVLVLRD